MRTHAYSVVHTQHDTVDEYLYAYEYMQWNLTNTNRFMRRKSMELVGMDLTKKISALIFLLF